uniref:Uncharacterized protein n=1 Tax=Romanomermis culicivorax TaxID=13658 RepID=A0A915JHG5_ROMCU
MGYEKGSYKELVNPDDREIKTFDHQNQSHDRPMKYCTYHSQCKHDRSECHQLRPQAAQPHQQSNPQWQNNQLAS